MRVLALNPGSNSLKFDLVDVHPSQTHAAKSTRLLTGAVDNIGKPTKLILTQNNLTTEHEGDFQDFTAATERALEALAGDLPHIDLAAVRVVHGGDAFTKAVPFDEKVRAEIERREPLAPLHNANSLKIIDVLQNKAPHLPIACAFDTAFHHTLPEHAWRYPIDREIADTHNIRRFGFHGLSHRYQLERYAHLRNKRPTDCSIVTLHLESGSSACAIQHGRSIDTSMGFTPLEGLMMGTRSGSVDPAILPFLCTTLGISADEALTILEKKSGLLAISGVSLDTRILRKRDDPASLLALRMFAHRTLHYVGAYLAILGEAEAVIFSGGIGENTTEVRTPVCEGLKRFGLHLDTEKNAATEAGDTHIHAAGSPLEAWVLHAEEGLQLAHECAQTL